jgi:hypothetical protein
MRYRPSLQDRLEPLFVIITRALATVGLVAVIAIIISVAQAGKAHAATPPAKSSCFPEDIVEHIALQGEIVQSALPEGDDLSGRSKGTKYTAIVLDSPICFAGADSEMIPMLEVEVPKKWLGHHVSVAGTLVYEGQFFGVENIMDIKRKDARK